MLTLTIGAAWQRAQRRDARACTARWSPLHPADRVTAAQWGRALAYGHWLASQWGTSAPADIKRSGLWQQADSFGNSTASAWNAVPARDAELCLGWDRSTAPRDIRLALIYNPNPALKDRAVGIRARRANLYGPQHDSTNALQASLYVPGSGALMFAFAGRPYFPSVQPSVFFDFRYQPATPAIQPTDSRATSVRWSGAQRLGLLSRLPWGRARVVDGALTGIAYPDYPGTVKPLPEPPREPDILDTYMIANTVNLVALPSRTPIEARNLRLSLDADSYSWAFTADIFTQAALDLVRPGINGPGELEVEVNGWTWVLLVERYSRNRKFPATAYSISGSTRSQLLAEPYAPLRTHLNGAAITARQAAEAELLNTGFTLEWDAQNAGPPDWTFPAGAFSYQGQTAMQVIARVAETVGAVVRPARDIDALEIRPRYPAPPWQWETVEAPISCIIPPAMMTDLAGEWTPQPAWNACYVSGTSHGVSMLVRRSGTAGDNPAPDVYDDWLTGQEANQARGIHELSKGGNIEIVGITIPLFHQGDDHGVGLVLPAQLCRVPEESGAWVGLCLSVEITAEGTGATRVYQKLKLERHH